MAGAVKNWAGLALCLTATLVWAQTADPTRPPAGWGETGASAEAATNTETEFRLQSVMLPQRGKPIALIGGQTVALGGKVGDATLVRLTEKEAVLQGPDGLTHLYLTPEVNKQMIVTPKARKTGKSGQLKDSP